MAQQSEIIPAKSKDLSWIMLGRVFLLALVTLFIYWPVRHGGWLMDDGIYLSGNTLLNDPARLWKAWFVPGSFVEYYPIEQSLQYLQWQLWHENTTGYHLTNIVLHFFSALLVWRLLSKFDLRLAWLGGLIFAVHPAMVETVAWIAEFKNTLSLPPFLLAMCFYLDYEARHRWHDYLLALGFFMIAMLCKISMASFPLVILLYAWWKRGRIGWSDLLASAPFFVVSVGLGLLSLAAGSWYDQTHHTRAEWAPLGGMMSHLAVVGLSTGFYFWNGVWPLSLLPIYPQWVVNPPSPAQFLPWPILLGLIYLLWKKHTSWGRPVLLGLGFFLILLGPFVVINIGGYTRFTWVMDHFLYIPIIGLIGLFVAGIEQIEARMTPALRPYGLGILASVLALLVWDSHSYARKFVNQKTLWTYELKYNPNAWLAENNLGLAYYGEENLDEAEAHLRQALAIRPNYPDAHTNLGDVLSQKGEFEAAQAEYQAALKIQPDSTAAHSNLGSLYMKTGQLEEAMAQYQMALKVDPNYIEANYNLGTLLYKMGQVEAAISQFQKTEKIAPNFPGASDFLGNIFLKQGREDEAMAQIRKALAIDPDFSEAHNNLGTLLLKRGQLDEAIAQFQMGLKTDPDNAEAHDNLGLALAHKGGTEEAMVEFQKALEINPNDAGACSNLGAIYFMNERLDEAKIQFQNGLKLDPNNAEAHNNLGAVYFKESKWDEAAAQFKEVLRLRPNDVRAQSNLAKVEAMARQASAVK